MARQRAARKDSRSKGGKQQDAGSGASGKGSGGGADTYEQELAELLQERIKPGLNRGSIALLARSIAKEIAQRRPDEDADVAREPSNEDDDDVHGEADSDVSYGEYDDVRG
jgi:hypothetical protein